jgi:hypothetical protein
MKRAIMVCSMLVLPSALFAEAGRTGAILLTRTLDARAAGLGQALTADAGDVGDFHFNPAGMARLDYPVVSATYQNGLLDDSLGVINYAHNTEFGSWFVGASALDAGTIDINQSDGTTFSRHAEQDAAGTLGVAFGRNGPWSVGLSATYFRSELAQTATAASIAGDAGLYWSTPLPGLQLAAAIQNVGSDLKYDQEKESLPTSERVGAAYVLDLQESLRTPDIFKCRYLLLVDGVKTKNDNLTYNAGLEVRKRINSDITPGWACLRGGYIAATKAVAIGVGFNLWNVSLDYALNIVSDINNTHRITLGYHFVPHHKSNVL